MPVLSRSVRPSRSVGALVVALAMLVIGVVVGRAIAGTDESGSPLAPTTEPTASTAASIIDDPVTRALVTDAGELIAVDAEDYPAAVAALRGEVPDASLTSDDGGADDRTEGSASPGLVPVVEPIYVGGVTDADVSAIGDALLDLPAPSSAVGAAAGAGLRPQFAGGATPASGSVPVELLDPDPSATSSEPPPDTATSESAPSETVTSTTPETAASETTTPATPDTTPGATGSAGTVATIDVPEIDTLPGLGAVNDLVDLLVDPCAGVRPGDPVPEECPPGTGATLLGIGSPPDPFLFWGRGHYLEPAGTDLVCPSDTAPPAPPSTVAMTLYSWTPLGEAEVSIRPYGSSVAWQPVTTTETSTAHRDAWNAEFAVREFDTSWGIVPHCLVVERDPEVSYEIRAVGTDMFGRAVESMVGLIAADSPDLRPPSGGIVLPSGPIARAHAWTVADGVVRFTHQVVDPADTDEPTCPATRGDDNIGASVLGRPVPVGLYDPDYTRRFQVDVPMPVAGAVVVCAYIYETDNTVRNPIHVDTMLFQAPAGERPRLVVQGIRRFGDETIERLTILGGDYLHGGGVFDPCGSLAQLRDVPPGDTVRVEETIYECGDNDLLRTDADGRMTVPVTLARYWGRDFETVELAVQIDVADCLTEPCGDRPRQWYEIPIPTRNRRLCGTVFGSGGCDPSAGAAGIAVLRLEYNRVGTGGPRDGTVTLIDQRDYTERTPYDELVVANMDLEVLSGTDPFVRSARVSFDTDRPIRGGVRVDTLPTRNPSDCLEGEPTTPPSEEFRDRFEIEVSGLCAGHTYGFGVYGVDEDGTEWEIDVSRLPWLRIPSPTNKLTATVELLGGPARLGYLYRLGVQVENQDLTAYWLELDAPERGTNPSCVALDGTTARSRGFWPPTSYGPPELTVTLYAHVTTTGDDDCSSRAGTGIEPIELTGTFTVDEFRTGDPLIVETPADSPLQIRATIEQDGGWTPG